MKRSFELKENFEASPKTLFEAWLNSEEHSKMTGGDAICSNEIGGTFSAWDEYIAGSNKVVKPYEEIIQYWRTAEFKEGDEDSELIIKFRETADGCELTLIHNNIPDGQPDYKQGWKEHYFHPMKNYFNHR